MTNGSLIKVGSIAECTDWSILQSFDLHQATIGLVNQFSVFLRVAVLHRFYCARILFFISINNADPDECKV